MADFFHSGWSIFIIASTVISIAACWWLAWNTSRAKAPPREPDGSVGTTGHVWDGDLQELNNPLPRWWLYLFYLTCAFSVLYLLLYPGLGTFKGLLGWTSGNQYQAEMQAANESYEPLFEQYLAQDIKAVAADPAAQGMGERLFLTYCSQCHGSTANGGRSFPNLTDNDWLGSGEPEYIKSTILNGRSGVMPAMVGAVGDEQDVEALANYVLSLSGAEHNSELLQRGAPKFAVCAACHGAQGGGNPLLGAPNLTDNIWLHAGTEDAIANAINNGLVNQMPAFGSLLSEGKAHVLAAYVWGLSNIAPTEQAE